MRGTFSLFVLLVFGMISTSFEGCSTKKEQPPTALDQFRGIRSSQTLWVGMDKQSVFSYFGNRAPDDTEGPNWYVFFHAKLLGDSSYASKCAVIFDSNDRLIRFGFVDRTGSPAFQVLEKNSIPILGKPTWRGNLMFYPQIRDPDSAEDIWWHFKNESYIISYYPRRQVFFSGIKTNDS